MLFKKLRLKNYCQYADELFEFSDGFTVLTGSNGAGKSNLLNALFFSLTGESMVEAKTRKKMLKWGEAKGYVELVFTYDRTDYTVRRYLQSSTMKMSWEDGDEACSLHKGSDIKDKITGLLRTNAPTLLLSSFMPQSGSTKLIFGTSVERMAEYGRLFGLTYMNKLRDKLRKMYTEVETFQDFSVELETLRGRLTTLLKKHSDECLNVEELENMLASLKDRYTECSTQATLPSKEVWEAGRSDLASKIKNAEDGLSSASKQLAGLGEVVVISTEEWKTASLFEDAQTLGRDMISMREGLSDLFITSKPDDFDMSKYSSVLSNMDMTRSMIAAYSAGACPTCGQPTSVDKVPELESELLRLEKSKVELEEAMRDNEAALKAHNDSVAARQLLEDKLREKAQALLKIAPLVETFDFDAFEDKKKKAEATESVRAERVRLESEVNRLTPLVESLKRELTSFEATSYRESAEDVSTFLASYEQLRDVLIPGAHSAKASLETEISMIEEQIKEKDKYTKMRELCEEHKDFLQQVRSVLHVDNLPKKLVLAYRKSLSELVGKYLSVFRQPFCVVIDDDLAPVCSFTDNPDASVFDLSGGQKMLLRIAFRLAISEMISSRVPFIAMDEPTNHLDADSKEYLTETFALVKEHLKHSDMQMLVSTHEVKIKQIADDIIEV